jgi:hypothetical protein
MNQVGRFVLHLLVKIVSLFLVQATELREQLKKNTIRPRRSSHRRQRRRPERFKQTKRETQNEK